MKRGYEGVAIGVSMLLAALTLILIAKLLL